MFGLETVEENHFVIFCFDIRREEEKETQNINDMGKTHLAFPLSQLRKIRTSRRVDFRLFLMTFPSARSTCGVTCWPTFLLWKQKSFIPALIRWGIICCNRCWLQLQHRMKYELIKKSEKFQLFFSEFWHLLKSTKSHPNMVSRAVWGGIWNKKCFQKPSSEQWT